MTTTMNQLFSKKGYFGKHFGGKWKVNFLEKYLPGARLGSLRPCMYIGIYVHIPVFACIYACSPFTIRTEYFIGNLTM